MSTAVDPHKARRGYTVADMSSMAFSILTNNELHVYTMKRGDSVSTKPWLRCTHNLTANHRYLNLLTLQKLVLPCHFASCCFQPQGPKSQTSTNIQITCFLQAEMPLYVLCMSFAATERKSNGQIIPGREAAVQTHLHINSLPTRSLFVLCTPPLCNHLLRAHFWIWCAC